MTMQSISQLTTLAVKSSQEGNWENGRDLNQQIVDQEPQNIGALNRLAFCYMQLGKTTEAKKTYEQVLKIQKFNSIAQKYLAILKQKGNFVPAVNQIQEDFIEEPGKTKSVCLQKLADPDVLQGIAISTSCDLIVKNHRVNVQTKQGKIYLGCLPDDIAFRLQKLIKIGNTYAVFVQSANKKNCIVFIKELSRSKEALMPSFLATSSGLTGIQEDVVLDEAPLDTNETGSDEGTHMDIPSEDQGNDDEME
ncbi:hypothetical protein C5B42_04165 [Candidatus Cerribacteria bacterium 'Amazon FNV 2010 28 9']|uniref:Uncharacterized protein n=1 Tax=Candidatus Cerribacteria bacterium 'Amazon FNV 2010 28 9' TaxID=2081795 RepID=A0A317JNB3_9BACT|nr:MAG: hypothetical protein C5B42_04165 [Candidatus Cerribacteria bacterium 'Amazon FNV 2010 28 9']